MSADPSLRWKTIRPTFLLPQLKKLSVRGRLAMAAPALVLVVGGAAVAVSAAGVPESTQLDANAVNPDCTLVVPANPLTAQGLATPYQLTATHRRQGGCTETNVNQSAFVQATIIDPATGKLTVFNPLVVTEGTKPAVAPVVPTLPAGAVVGIWFGFNGNNLTLRGDLAAASCVNGERNSVFGQFAACNATAFFTAANQAVAGKRLVIPPLGTGRDGKTCLSTRDFGLVDQDQSDNVTTRYLTTRDGQTAQDTPANEARLGNRDALTNGSDNLLLDAFEDPALGCRPFTATDLASGQPSTSLALDELQAAARQTAPVALVPENDPMVLVNGKPSTTKANLYRAAVDMAPINPRSETSTGYCRDVTTIGQQRIQLDENFTKRATSPDPAAAKNLFTFLAQRLNQTFVNLGCGALLHEQNPVRLVTDKAGIVTDATFATQTKAAPANVPDNSAPTADPQPGKW